MNSSSDFPPSSAPDDDAVFSRHPNSRREFLLGGLLLAAAGTAYARLPRERIDYLGDAKLEDLVPERLGDWTFYSASGLVVPPEDEFQSSIYSQVLTRFYVSENRIPMMLLIATSSSQDGTVQVHRPEFCYPAGGFALTNGRDHAIQLPGRENLDVRLMTAENNERIEQMLYWTRVGEYYPTSWLAQRMAVAQANLKGVIPDATLIRISAISPDPMIAGELENFAKVLIQSVSGNARKLLLGS